MLHVQTREKIIMSRNVGILGSGMVGQALALGFNRSGYDVAIGTRNPDKLADFLAGQGRVRVYV